MTCTDCGRPVRTRTATRCRQCACRHTYHRTHPTKGTTAMNTNAATTEPTMGDIGPEEEVEFEPLEVPFSTPETAPVEQPVPESVPA